MASLNAAYYAWGLDLQQQMMGEKATKQKRTPGSGLAYLQGLWGSMFSG